MIEMLSMANTTAQLEIFEFRERMLCRLTLELSGARLFACPLGRTVRRRSHWVRRNLKYPSGEEFPKL
jgi:hypothetical protein